MTGIRRPMTARRRDTHRASGPLGTMASGPTARPTRCSAGNFFSEATPDVYGLPGTSPYYCNLLERSRRTYLAQ